MKWIDGDGSIWKYREGLCRCGRCTCEHGKGRAVRVEAAPPVRTVCAWCPAEAPTVLVDVPEDERGISHGICPSCSARWTDRTPREPSSAVV